MCYPKPGPRCSNHTRAKMNKAAKVLKEEMSYEAMAAYKEAEDAWLSSPAGIKHLRARGDYAEATRRATLRENAIAAIGGPPATESHPLTRQEWTIAREQMLERYMEDNFSESDLFEEFANVPSGVFVSQYYAGVERTRDGVFVSGWYDYDDEDGEIVTERFSEEVGETADFIDYLEEENIALMERPDPRLASR